MKKGKIIQTVSLVAFVFAFSATVLHRFLFGMTLWDENGIQNLSAIEVFRDYHAHPRFWFETFIIFLWVFLPCLLTGCVIGFLQYREKTILEKEGS